MVGYQSFLNTDALDAGTYTTRVAKVRNITGPDIDVDDIDVTSMDSSSGFREFLPGLADGGEVGLDLILEEDELALLFSYVRTMREWKVTFSSGATWTFNGYLKGLTQSINHDGAIEGTATIKVDEQPIFTKSS